MYPLLALAQLHNSEPSSVCSSPSVAAYIPVLVDIPYFMIAFFNYNVGVKSLTKSDLRILKIALAEHLHKLEESGINLKQGDHPRITKEVVIIGLLQVGQQELSRILRQNKGKSINLVRLGWRHFQLVCTFFWVNVQTHNDRE